MAISQFLVTLLTLVTGAALGFLPTYVLERRKEQIVRATRWDTVLHTAANEIVASARRAQHLAGQLAAGGQDRDQADRLDEEHQRLRVAVEQMRMIGSGEVQVAARSILRHSYALRLVADGTGDPYAAQHAGIAPRDRLREAHLEFYRAVRRQLRVTNSDDVPADVRPGPDQGFVLPRDAEERIGFDRGNS